MLYDGLMSEISYSSLDSSLFGLIADSYLGLMTDNAYLLTIPNSPISSTLLLLRDLPSWRSTSDLDFLSDFSAVTIFSKSIRE